MNTTKIFTVCEVVCDGSEPSVNLFKSRYKAENFFKKIVKEQFSGMGHPRSVVRQKVKEAISCYSMEGDFGYGLFLSSNDLH
jgi:hypothetical protein